MNLPGRSPYIVGVVWVYTVYIVDVLAWPEIINCGRWSMTTASGI